MVSEGTVEAENAPPQMMSFVVPTDFVELPSKGHFYPEGHALFEQDSIEIRHMTAKDEDILTSRTLLKRGVALDRMLQNIIVNKKLDVKSLLIGDKNALLVAARISGYGAEYNTKVACPVCSATNQYSFDLNSLLDREYNLEEILDEWDVQITQNNTFSFLLPKTNYTVELRLLTGVDENKLSQLGKTKKKHGLGETSLTDYLRAILVSISGDSSPTTLHQFIEHLPAIDARYIRKVYQDLMPSVNMNHSFSCIECSHDDEVEVPFNTDFFWPKQ